MTSQDAILSANKLMSQFSWTSFVDAETATKTRDAIAAALDEAAQERDELKNRYNDAVEENDALRARVIRLTAKLKELGVEVDD